MIYSLFLSRALRNEVCLIKRVNFFSMKNEETNIESKYLKKPTSTIHRSHFLILKIVFFYVYVSVELIYIFQLNVVHNSVFLIEFELIK